MDSSNSFPSELIKEMRSMTRLYVLSAIVAGSFIGPARADTIYTYTGNDFVDVTSPYTTSNYLSAVLDFIVPLRPNFQYQQVIPDSFILTSGVAGDAITSNYGSAGFYIQTDGSGDIDGWYIGASSPVVPFTQTQYTLYDGAQFDYASYGDGSGGVGGAAGQWITSVSAVPEPSSLIIGVVALTGLWELRRRLRSAARSCTMLMA